MNFGFNTDDELGKAIKEKAKMAGMSLKELILTSILESAVREFRRCEEMMETVKDSTMFKFNNDAEKRAFIATFEKGKKVNEALVDIYIQRTGDFTLPYDLVEGEQPQEAPTKAKAVKK